MSRLTEVSPPTVEALRKRAAVLADDLKGLLRQSPVPVRPDVGFEADTRSGDIGISGDTASRDAITALIRRRPEIGRQIQEITSLGRLLAASEREADALRTTRAAQIGAVVDDYAARPGGHHDAQDFSRIPGRSMPGATEAGRILEKYAAASGASDTAAKISLVFDGKDVQVLADGRPWN